ncbi:hypothetical protein M0D21_12765 [Aquimarina sp. D1M17]|uniref:hypothetical protein n=1 Tax=Aquimarina acroporae TaxID=2937283 RepID=UPI0020C06EF3|nr:hypothetical protein [Aquimarina acroporae]MCK8522449.1 hypothetical protein [Aquimarina acroporae]
MNFYSAAHIFCYVSIALIFYVGLFFGNEELIILKPVSSLGLIWVYLENRKKVNALYPLIIIIIMVNDILILKDFEQYFKYVGILLTLYYLMCSYLLLPFISFSAIRSKEFLTPSVLISIVLILYLTFSIFTLSMPNFEDSIGFAVAIIVSLFIYLACCFIIYLRNLHTYTHYLAIAGSSCILVNAMLPIQEFYYNNSVFQAVIYSADIVAMLFFLKFLISGEVIKEKNGNSYF